MDTVKVRRELSLQLLKRTQNLSPFVQHMENAVPVRRLYVDDYVDIYELVGKVSLNHRNENFLLSLSASSSLT